MGYFNFTGFKEHFVLSDTRDTSVPPAEPAHYVDDAMPGCSRDSHSPEDLQQSATQDNEATLELEPATELPPIAEQVNLDNDVLELLGEAPEPECKLGKPIHKDVAARWLDIIKKGLNKESKEQLAKDYLIPENCELLIPPILNPEAKAALTEPSIKRDASLMIRQKQLGNALAALAPAIEIIISKDFDQSLRTKLLKPVNDACRILCDMHHSETVIRKKFVVSSISTGLKDTLSSTCTDKYLFGDNMSEKIKNAKNVQKSGEALKNSQKPQKQGFTKFNGYKNRLNFKTLHQRTASKQDAGKNQLAPRQYQQQSSRAPPRRTARDRSPPPPPSPPPRRRTTRHR